MAIASKNANVVEQELVSQFYMSFINMKKQLQPTQ